MAAFDARRQRLRQRLRQAKADALLVTSFHNVTYLTGFTGDDSYLLVTLDSEVLVTDLRYSEQLETECPGLPLAIRGPGEAMLPTTAATIDACGVEVLGIEAASMTVALHRALAERLPMVRIEPVEGAVEALRAVKDRDEIEATRLAVYQAERAFHVVRAGLTPTTSELDIAAELEYQARRFGAKALAFTPIVGVGPRSALPHGHATSKRVGEADFLLIDWGANSGLYHSDLTRMVVTGKLSQKFRSLYQVVLDAQLAAIDAIAPGVPCDHVDKAARDVIARAGHAKRFGHGLGHGTGLQIHEAPRLSHGQGHTKLEPGMIVTVEPGIYFPGWGGIRIEDDILVTKTGHEVLTSVPKNIDDCILR